MSTLEILLQFKNWIEADECSSASACIMAQEIIEVEAGRTSASEELKEVMKLISGKKPEPTFCLSDGKWFPGVQEEYSMIVEIIESLK